ncbi:MAG: hypothetical protein J6X12_04160 [Paludibacteraceae bacterium]|nr:hypothetical protein [Paludibacteraceae bacterium]
MSESIKKVGCELHELSCQKDFGKVEVLPTNGVGGNESCKHIKGACADEFKQIAVLGNEVKVKQSILEHVLGDSRKTNATPLCERVVDQKVAADCPDLEVVDNTKSIVDIADKIAPDGLDRSHASEKTVVDEPIAVKDPVKENSEREVPDADPIKKSPVKDVVEELRSPKCEDSVGKVSKAIASEKSLKSSEIYSDRASDGSADSGDKSDKIVRGSKVAEPSVDESGTKSLDVKNEHPQEISVKVEEKVDDGKKVDKDETSEDKISEGKAVYNQKVASVKDESPGEVSVKGEFSNKNTISDIEQQDKSDLTKKSKNNE